MKHFRFLILACAILATASAKEAPPAGIIAYYLTDRTIADPDKCCMIDMRLPAEGEGFATPIWFHGVSR